MCTFFIEEVGQWFANPGLSRKRVCRKPNLVVRVDRKFKKHLARRDRLHVQYILQSVAFLHDCALGMQPCAQLG